MSSQLEYDDRVRHWIPASIALCTLLSLPLLFVSTIFVSTSQAQSGGASAAASSSGGGHSAGGVAAGGVSFGAHGSGFSPGASSSGSSGWHSGTSHSHPGNPGVYHRYNNNGGEYLGPVWYAVPFPYVESDNGSDANDNADASADTDDDADYQGGPTVFDRRGLGAESYVPPVEDATQPQSSADADPDDTPQPATVLVFKDGHAREVENYAIVGVTLFDLTPGHARRIALADLDLEATQKQNDDRGVVFALPASPQAN
jgi:hypothetical protein